MHLYFSSIRSIHAVLCPSCFINVSRKQLPVLELSEKGKAVCLVALQEHLHNGPVIETSCQRFRVEVGYITRTILRESHFSVGSIVAFVGGCLPSKSCSLYARMTRPTGHFRDIHRNTVHINSYCIGWISEPQRWTENMYLVRLQKYRFIQRQSCKRNALYSSNYPPCKSVPTVLPLSNGGNDPRHPPP